MDLLSKGVSKSLNNTTKKIEYTFLIDFFLNAYLFPMKSAFVEISSTSKIQICEMFNFCIENGRFMLLKVIQYFATYDVLL